MIAEHLFAEDAAQKAYSVLIKYPLDKWVVSYSGGSDSDTLMWFLRSLGFEPRGVFFNTGLEYAATKRQVVWMRSQGFNIEEVKATRTVPVAIKKAGVPFWSKHVSQMLHRLSLHDFRFEDLPFDILMQHYSNCKAALLWWTNGWDSRRLNISWVRGLKEFLVANPPSFPIHSACCDWAKKHTSQKYAKDHGIELMLTGVRRAEGGERLLAYKACFLPGSKYRKYAVYMPLFWWSHREKETWDREHGIKHSDCYGVYGLDRTGCVGCPFGKYYERELEVLQRYEPLLYKAANNIFGKSYAYMKAFERFRTDRVNIASLQSVA